MARPWPKNTTGRIACCVKERLKVRDGVEEGRSAVLFR
jgi:hypothetical protein